MSKGILVYKLPEEQDSFQLAQDAGKFYSVIWEFQAWCRSELKYKEMSAAKRKAIEEARNKFLEILSNNGVEL